MKFRQLVKEYFSFSRGERIGLVVLILFIVTLILANQVVFYFERPAAADREAFNRILASLDQEKAAAEELSLFAFEPNTIDSATFFKLNLPDKVKRNWLNFRRHGGQVRKPSDFRRIYGMTDSVYMAIEPFILVVNTSEAERTADNSTRKSWSDYGGYGSRGDAKPVTGSSEHTAPGIHLEMNSADASDWEALPGIGTVLSKRILKYRDLLGGFVSIEQLKEVYGLKPEIVDSIRSCLLIDDKNIRKIDINFLTVDELAKHPYFNYKEARKIVDFRSKNGYISNKYQLVTDSVIDEKLYRKVVLYLK